jgi:undecaprenyl diphosphate synthase
VPRHVALIMDGNGRWAKQRGLSRQAGHRAGTENIRRIIQAFGERGVEVLTLYAFSTENWTRPRREVSALMRLIPRVISREIKELHKNGVRLVHIGRLDPLEPKIREKVEQAIELTKDNDRMTVALAFNYGGRDEILDATRRMLADRVKPERVDEALFVSYLYTSEIGDPDVIIRTAGEMRLRTSCCGSPPTLSSTPRRRSGPTSTRPRSTARLDAYASASAGSGRRAGEWREASRAQVSGVVSSTGRQRGRRHPRHPGDHLTSAATGTSALLPPRWLSHRSSSTTSAATGSTRSAC